MTTGKLNERAMLVTLNISSWGGMMHDQEVTDEVGKSHKAEADAGRYNKRLASAKFFKGISGSHSNARRVHRVFTLPWEDDGTRVLPTTGYVNYQVKMNECQHKVEAEVKAFLKTRDEFIREAKVRLGSMFDETDYPDLDTLKTKFGFDVEIKPMPEANDFRAKVSDANMKSIIKDIERRTDARLQKAMNDVFLRVKEVVEHMAIRLRAYTPPTSDAKANGIIRDSLIYNISELAKDVLPVLNITDDPRITELQKQLLSELVEHSPEILRSDAKVRKETISKADKLLKKLETWMK